MKLQAELRAGRVEQVWTRARARLERNPKDGDALLALAKIAVMEGALGDALVLADRAAALGIDVALVRAAVAADAGDDARALAIYRDVLARSPCAEARFGAARILAEHGAYAESRKLLEAALDDEPASPVLHAYLGRVCLELGEVSRARSELSRAIELAPAYVPAYQSLAALLRAAGDFDGARATLLGGIEAIPGEPVLVEELIDLCLAGGDLGTAYEQAKKAAARDPASPIAAANLALMHLARGCPEETLRAIARAPAAAASAPLRALEGAAKTTLGDTRGAIAAYRAAMALDTRDHKAANELGLLLLSSGAEEDRREAASVLAEAHRRAPGAIEPAFNLALALAKNGDRAGAQRHAALVFAGAPEGHALRGEAESLLRLLLRTEDGDRRRAASV